MAGSGAVCVVGELGAYNLQSRRYSEVSLSSCNSYVEFHPCSVKPLVLPQPTRSKSRSRTRTKTRRRSLVILDNLGGQYEDNFEDVQRQMLDFFTYKAVRTVMKQLNEMNPTQYRWFHDYIASNELGYGKSFIRHLGKEKYEIADKIMVTRLRLYGKWVKKCDHVEMYKRISDQNLELLRERLLETVVWPPSDEEVVG